MLFSITCDAMVLSTVSWTFSNEILSSELPSSVFKEKNEGFLLSFTRIFFNVTWHNTSSSVTKFLETTHHYFYNTLIFSLKLKKHTLPFNACDCLQTCDNFLINNNLISSFYASFSSSWTQLNWLTPPSFGLASCNLHYRHHFRHPLERKSIKFFFYLGIKH